MNFVLRSFTLRDRAFLTFLLISQEMMHEKSGLFRWRVSVSEYNGDCWVLAEVCAQLGNILVMNRIE